MEQKRFYEVCCKCGHVGRDNYILITFAICAENGRKAADIARWLPRVKHHVKDAIQYCHEISLADYLNLKEASKKNAYLHCQSSKDQKEHPEIQENVVFGERQTESHHAREKVAYHRLKEEIQNEEAESELLECYSYLEGDPYEDDGWDELNIASARA